ncbi:unnamed protein product [Parnassius mnemosyne]|uniref:PHD-type domain-containing protein n=1 Tax=Parnassius mnemosyne TaxID=213953 RepID=A0AAV1KXP0_9NEOP
MNCSACNKKILRTDRCLECNQCHLKYHIECLNLKKEQFTALTTEYKSKWMCPSCTNITKRKRSSVNTPVQQTLVPLVENSMNSSLENSCCSLTDSQLFSANDDNLVTMGKISTLLDKKLNNYLSDFVESFRKSLKDDVKNLVQAEMYSMVQQLKHDFTVTTNFICDEQSSLKQEIENKSHIIKHLESETLRFQKEINVLTNRLTSIEKISRNKNLEIQLVPESRNENPMILFRNLCKTVDLQIDDENIHSCRRVAKYETSSNRPRNIIVTLINPRLRDQVLSACYRYNKAHKDNPLNTNDIGLHCEKRKMYVTEHLSPECKALHAAARKFAKEKKYKYVWVKYGRIYIRKEDTAACIHIRNMDCLKKLS